MIIVRDLSRLGRDYIEVGDYLEQIFPVLGIRFIAVNSYYDSNDYIGKTIGMDVTISNLVNHLYSRDISTKIKSANASNWKRGKTTRSRAPFGYKCGESKHEWVIDDEAAEVVQLIFHLAGEGWTTSMIVEHLNQMKLETPGQHRQRITGDRVAYKTVQTEKLWTQSMVCLILHRLEYTGCMVHGKRRKLNVGSDATRTVPYSERFLIENAHPAIIDKAQYEQAQIIFAGYGMGTYRIPKSFSLRKKVKCGNCRLALEYKELNGKRLLYCYHKRGAGSSARCCEDFYSLDQIESSVLQASNKQLELLREVNHRISAVAAIEQKRKRQVANHVESQIEKLKTERIHQYEAYATGVISKEEYLKQRQIIAEEIQRFEEESNRIVPLDDSLQMMAEKLGQYTDNEGTTKIERLTSEIVQRYIETVYMYDSEHMEIVFSFDDLLMNAVEQLSEETKSA